MQGQYFFSQSHLKSFCSEIVSTDACSYPPNAFNHKSNNIFEMCKMVPQWSLICQNKKVWDSSIFFPPNLEKINFIYRPACSYNFQDGVHWELICVSGLVVPGCVHFKLLFEQLFSSLAILKYFKMSKKKVLYSTEQFWYTTATALCELGIWLKPEKNVRSSLNIRC